LSRKASSTVTNDDSFRKTSISSETSRLPEVSCIGELLFETKIIEKVGQQSFFLPVKKHFGDQFSTQMVLSVLASFHDVLEQVNMMIAMNSTSSSPIRDDIDFCRLEEAVNDFFVTCLSRSYFRGGSTQSNFTFEASFKVWNECLPLVCRCFSLWSMAMPFQTKQWQEYFYHFLNLKITIYEDQPVHQDIVNQLEKTLIRSHSTQDFLALMIHPVENDTEEKKAIVNKYVKMRESGKQLLAGNTETIIDALVFREAEFGSAFKEVFFCGFRNFITPIRLLCYLMGCVHSAIPELFSKSGNVNSNEKQFRSQSSATIPRVMNLLKYWISTYGSDWDEHLVGAAHVLLERCASQASQLDIITECDIDNADDDSIKETASARPASLGNKQMLGKRVPSINRLDLNHNRESKDAINSSSSSPVEAVFAAETPPSSSAFVLANEALHSSLSHMVQHKPTSPKTATTQRSSRDVVMSTFQVFVRAMVKHLKSTSRFEQDSSDDPFISLPSKSVKVPISARPVFQFFRQNVNAGDLFLMTSPRHWAQCLTLHSFHIFRKFQPEEFFREPFPAWQVKPDSLKKVLVPNISANTDFFNLVKNFFVGCIFRADIASRKRALMHVIDIADSMMQMNNFDGMFSAMSALDSCGVYRLKKLWSSISSPEYDLKLSELRFLMESRNKFANYTAALRSASPPKLPYVGHFLGSLFMQSERHPKVRRTKHKNIFPPLTYLPDY
jgi:hypothetical protein